MPYLKHGISKVVLARMLFQLCSRGWRVHLSPLTGRSINTDQITRQAE